QAPNCVRSPTLVRSKPIILWRIDRVRARLFRRGRHFRLRTRLCECAYTRRRLDDHPESVTDCDLGSLAQAAVDYDEEAIPPLSDVAVEPDTVRAAGNEPAVAARVEAHWLPRPPRLRIERNEDNRDALVTFDQLSFESHLVHSLPILWLGEVEGKPRRCSPPCLLHTESSRTIVKFSRIFTHQILFQNGRDCPSFAQS